MSWKGVFMKTCATAHPGEFVEGLPRNPTYQAYEILHWGFVIAPVTDYCPTYSFGGFTIRARLCQPSLRSHSSRFIKCTSGYFFLRPGISA